MLAMKAADAVGEAAGERHEELFRMAAVEPVRRPAAAGRLMYPQARSAVALA
jgi:hypothetical protein